MLGNKFKISSFLYGILPNSGFPFFITLCINRVVFFISLAAPEPILIICPFEFLFFKSDTDPETTYKSKNGKYQGQTSIQVAKIK